MSRYLLYQCCSVLHCRVCMVTSVRWPVSCGLRWLRSYISQGREIDPSWPWLLFKFNCRNRSWCVRSLALGADRLRQTRDGYKISFVIFFMFQNVYMYYGRESNHVCIISILLHGGVKLRVEYILLLSIYRYLLILDHTYNKCVLIAF